MKTLFKIFYATFYICVISIIALLLFALFPVKGNYQIKIVKSGSMEPSISIGSIVVIKPQKVYEMGDVVTFGKDTRKEIPITHRIASGHVDNGVQYFRTKGDANEDVDNRDIKATDILGKVLFDVPYLGFVIDMARKPAGFAILVIIPALIIIYDEFVKIFKEIRRIRRKKLEESQPSNNQA